MHCVERLRAASTEGDETWAPGVHGTRVRHTHNMDRPQLDFAVAQDADGSLQLKALSSAEDCESPPKASAAARQSQTWTPSEDSSAQETLEAVAERILQN